MHSLSQKITKASELRFGCIFSKFSLRLFYFLLEDKKSVCPHPLCSRRLGFGCSLQTIGSPLLPNQPIFCNHRDFPLLLEERVWGELLRNLLREGPFLGSASTADSKSQINPTNDRFSQSPWRPGVHPGILLAKNPGASVGRLELRKGS